MILTADFRRKTISLFLPMNISFGQSWMIQCLIIDGFRGVKYGESENVPPVQMAEA